MNLCDNDTDTANFTNDTDFYRIFAYWMNGGLTSVLFLQGLVCNLLTLLAFYSHTIPKPSIYKYLMAVAIWDMALISSAFALYSLPTLIHGKQNMVGSYVVVLPGAYYFCNTALIGSLWTIVALTVDRYFAVCYPLKHRSYGQFNITKLLLILSFCACCYNIPRMLDFAIETCILEENTGTWEFILVVTNVRRNFVYSTLYKICGGLLFYSATPFLVLFALSTAISLKLKSANRERRKMARARSRALTMRGEKDTSANNVLLLAVILKFLASHILPTVLDVAEAALGSAFGTMKNVSYAVVVSNCLVVLNSCTNFWLYVTCSVTFRHDCQRVLSGHLRPQKLSALKAIGPLLKEATLKWHPATLAASAQVETVELIHTFREKPLVVNRKDSKEQVEVVKNSVVELANGDVLSDDDATVFV